MKNKAIRVIHSYLRQHILSNCLVFLCVMIVCNPLFSQEKITANLLYQKADSIASTFVSTPTIHQIMSEDIDTSGKAVIWNYKFINDFMEPTTYANIYLGLDSVSYDTIQFPLTGYALMDSGWIDSDSALAIAEKNGGREFRMTHGDVTISSDLSKASASPFTTWLIEYNNFFYISINALTGKVLYNSAVISYESDYHFQMLQNYPNPGNPQTTIRYALPEARPVVLTIYNVLGQKICVLVDVFQEAGMHEVIWDGKDSMGITVSSGTYIYHFEAGEHRFTRKLTLLK